MCLRTPKSPRVHNIIPNNKLLYVRINCTFHNNWCIQLHVICCDCIIAEHLTSYSVDVSFYLTTMYIGPSSHVKFH